MHHPSSFFDHLLALLSEEPSQMGQQCIIFQHYGCCPRAQGDKDGFLPSVRHWKSSEAQIQAACVSKPIPFVAFFLSLLRC